MSEFFRETKPISGGQGRRDYKVWALVIMEAEKSLNLLSVSWRTRKASGVLMPENWRIHGVDSSLGVKAREPGTPRAREDQDVQLMLRVHSAFFCPIGLFGPSSGWMVATCTGELCANTVPCTFLTLCSCLCKLSLCKYFLLKLFQFECAICFFCFGTLMGECYSKQQLNGFELDYPLRSATRV